MTTSAHNYRGKTIARGKQTCPAFGRNTRNHVGLTFYFYNNL